MPGQKERLLSVQYVAIYPLCPCTGCSCIFVMSSCLVLVGTSIWSTLCISVSGPLDFLEHFISKSLQLMMRFWFTFFFVFSLQGFSLHVFVITLHQESAFCSSFSLLRKLIGLVVILQLWSVVVLILFSLLLLFFALLA